MKTQTSVSVIIIVAVIAFLIGYLTQPAIQPVSRQTQTYADSIFDIQYAQYEADIAKDTVKCVVNGKVIVCKNVATLGGYINWKTMKGIK
jgi:predicted secreted acid phosphatase